MPELLAGTTIMALDTPPTIEASDSTNISSVSSTSYITGSPQVSAQFLAPTYGRVLAVVSAGLQSDGTASMFASFEVREYSASGAQIVAPDDDQAVRNQTVDIITGSNAVLVEGLTPGLLYFIRVLYRVSSGSAGFIAFRGIGVNYTG